MNKTHIARDTDMNTLLCGRSFFETAPNVIALLQAVEKLYKGSGGRICKDCLRRYNLNAKVVRDVVEYLDDLRESGVTNMMGAVPYVTYTFPAVSKRIANVLHSYWMQSYEERHHEET
jgi:hypothetical protein